MVKTLVRSLALLLFACGLCSAQYTDVVAIDHLGGPKEFARRRQQLAQELKTGYVLLFARNIIPEATHYREDTILITNGDPKILSSGVPKELAEIEKLVGSAR